MKKLLLALLLLTSCATAYPMEKAIFIGDSTFAGNNAITEPTRMAGYLLTQKSGVYIYDLSRAGTAINRRIGFPNNAIPIALNDLRPVITRLDGQYVFIMMGTNDYDFGHDLQEVKSELKSFALYVKNQGKIPVIISPLSTINERSERPLLDSWRYQFQLLADAINVPFIDGKTLSDCNNPDLMDDGVHRSELGMDDLTTHITAIMRAKGLWH